MKRADLHVHTYFSDGTFSPERVIEEAEKRKLAAVAISDHDCVDGIALAEQAGKEHGVEVIPAIELSAERNDVEIHILGYFIRYNNNKEFKEFLEKLRQDRIERMLKIISKLKNLGIEIDMEDILKTAGPGAVGRLHLAYCLKEKGYVRNMYDAFNQYLGEGKPAYVKRKNLPPEKAIAAIEKLGGVSVLAHPHTVKDESIIEDLIKMGIEGIEAYHSDHAPRVSGYFQKLAKNYNLIVTGGSDCHGLRKEKIMLGNVTVPYSVVDALREKSLLK